MTVFSLRRPDPDLDEVERLSLSYKGRLSTEGLDALDAAPHRGFNRDTSSVVIGHGAGDFLAAQSAMTAWTMFSMPWITLRPPLPRIELGRIAVVVVRALGVIYVTNASRITMLVDELTETGHRWGFVYATLSRHAQQGEEIFLVTHDFTSDEVRYSLVAHSRPSGWVAWLGYPVTRWYQRRFRRESAAAMRSATNH